VTSYYVYYRVDPARVETVRSAVRALFDAIERETGVRGTWMRRRDEATTFMEVYEGVADEHAFEVALARESAALGLERKTERFICA
jgi:quinol monooxygenase YgiN